MTYVFEVGIKRKIKCTQENSPYGGTAPLTTIVQSIPTCGKVPPTTMRFENMFWYGTSAYFCQKPFMNHKISQLASLMETLGTQ